MSEILFLFCFLNWALEPFTDHFELYVEHGRGSTGCRPLISENKENTRQKSLVGGSVIKNRNKNDDPGVNLIVIMWHTVRQLRLAKTVFSFVFTAHESPCLPEFFLDTDLASPNALCDYRHLISEVDVHRGSPAN